MVKKETDQRNLKDGYYLRNLNVRLCNKASNILLKIDRPPGNAGQRCMHLIIHRGEYSIKQVEAIKLKMVCNKLSEIFRRAHHFCQQRKHS